MTGRINQVATACGARGELVCCWYVDRCCCFWEAHRCSSGAGFARGRVWGREQGGNGEGERAQCAHADPPPRQPPLPDRPSNAEPGLGASLPHTQVGGAPGRHDLCWPAHRVWIRRRRRGGCRQSAYACGTDASLLQLSCRAGGGERRPMMQRAARKAPPTRSIIIHHPPTHTQRRRTATSRPSAGPARRPQLQRESMLLSQVCFGRRFAAQVGCDARRAQSQPRVGLFACAGVSIFQKCTKKQGRQPQWHCNLFGLSSFGLLSLWHVVFLLCHLYGLSSFCSVVFVRFWGNNVQEMLVSQQLLFNSKEFAHFVHLIPQCGPSSQKNHFSEFARN